MKVKIGKYVRWIGPYQLAEFLLFWRKKKLLETDDLTHSFGKYLSKTWISSVLEWIYSKQTRKEYVKIEYHDTWNAYHTLSLIIHPLLVELGKDKHGAPHVDDEDVPDNLKRIPEELVDKDGWSTTDSNWFPRWDYVLNEMIWTFDQIKNNKEDGTDFWSGDFDTNFKEIPDGYFEMVHGPKHTAKFDKEGYEVYKKRLDNGLRLFAKYYLNLWT